MLHVFNVLSSSGPLSLLLCLVEKVIVVTLGACKGAPLALCKLAINLILRERPATAETNPAPFPLLLPCVDDHSIIKNEQIAFINTLDFLPRDLLKVAQDLK